MGKNLAIFAAVLALGLFAGRVHAEEVPVITSINPQVVSPAGGTIVEVNGTNFMYNSKISLIVFTSTPENSGNVMPEIVRPNTATRIRFISPFIGGPGYAYVRVINPTGENSTIKVLKFKDLNVAPVANAGPDQRIIFPALAALHGTATDDGLPNPPAMLTYYWIKKTGPGNVSFANDRLKDTTASFSTRGTYVLLFYAIDNNKVGEDEVTINVQ